MVVKKILDNFESDFQRMKLGLKVEERDVRSS